MFGFARRTLRGSRVGPFEPSFVEGSSAFTFCDVAAAQPAVVNVSLPFQSLRCANHGTDGTVQNPTPLLQLQGSGAAQKPLQSKGVGPLSLTPAKSRKCKDRFTYSAVKDPWNWT